MKQRIITALILLIIFIPIILLGIIFNLVVLSIGIIGLKEMLEIKDIKNKLPLVMKLMTFGSFIYLVSNMSVTNDFVFLLDYRSIAVIIMIILLPIIIYHNNNVYNINDALFLVGTIFFLGLSFNLFIMLRDHNLMILLYLMIITITTDTFAFIGGSLVGEHKLLESISPKKTWEGLVVGTLLGTLFSSVFYYIAINDSIEILYLIFGTIMLSLIGQLGDLVFSSIKRLYNKKDFSNIFPGHGGVLDRLDSLLFVVLGYVLLMVAL